MNPFSFLSKPPPNTLQGQAEREAVRVPANSTYNVGCAADLHQAC